MSRFRGGLVLLLAIALVQGVAGGCAEPGGSPAGSADPRYEDHKRRALALYREGDFDGAIAETRKAVALAPKDREACGFLSRLHIESGRDREAADLFARLAKRCPDCASFWFFKGFHEFRLARWDDALASFGRAAAADPSNAEAEFRRGLVFQAKGDFPSAAEALGRAHALDPSAPLIAARYGRILRILGRYDEADRIVSETLERAPNSAELWHARAQLREREGKLAEAESALRKALALNPSYREAHHDLARLLLRSGKQAEGLREKALARRLADYFTTKESLLSRSGADPSNPDLPLSIAELELTEKSYEEASRWLARARMLGAPEDRWVPLAVEICAGKGRLDPCRDELAALEHDEGPRALLARAAVAAAAGQAAELGRLLDRLSREAPEEREFLRRVADLESVAGREARAAQWLERAERASGAREIPAGAEPMTAGEAEP